MAKKVLVVESSPRGDGSATRALTKELLISLKAKYPDLQVTVHDLVKNPPPHITGAMIGAYYTPEANHTPAQKEDLRLSNEYLSEFLPADIVVLAAPMWNFNIPSSMKAWIDHIVRVGKTFAYLPEGGYKGLAGSKKVYILSASGGKYSEGPMKGFNFNDPYLRTVLGFIGITDVETYSAEGVTNPETQAKAVAAAEEKMRAAVK